MGGPSGATWGSESSGSTSVTSIQDGQAGGPRCCSGPVPGTVELAIAALAFAVVVGIPLGYFAARRQGSALDGMSVVGSLIGITIPVFFLAFLLQYVFAVKLGWLPAVGPAGPAHQRPPTSRTSSCWTAC